MFRKSDNWKLFWAIKKKEVITPDLSCYLQFFTASLISRYLCLCPNFATFDITLRAQKAPELIVLGARLLSEQYFVRVSEPF